MLRKHQIDKSNGMMYENISLHTRDVFPRPMPPGIKITAGRKMK